MNEDNNDDKDDNEENPKQQLTMLAQRHHRLPVCWLGSTDKGQQGGRQGLMTRTMATIKKQLIQMYYV